MGSASLPSYLSAYAEDHGLCPWYPMKHGIQTGLVGPGGMRLIYGLQRPKEGGFRAFLLGVFYHSKAISFKRSMTLI
jgi:hypothetical protein